MVADVAGLKMKKKKMQWVRPMLATLHKNQALDQDWIFETKWDGFRALIFCEKGKITIMSRNHKDYTQHFPELLAAFQHWTKLKGIKGNDFIVDGEIVVMKKGVSNFSALVERVSLGPSSTVLRKMPVCFYAFDLIYFGGYALESLPLLKRKEMLKTLFPFKKPLFYTKHYGFKDKNKLIRIAKKEGWEGVMAKDVGAQYYHRRTTDWLKIKWGKRQEFVIGGFTAPQGSRLGFGALLLGYYQRKQLKYAGKVGTGYTLQLLDDLFAKLIKLKTKKSPYSESETVNEKNVTWVKPQLIGEVKFTEWTPDGRLRHPSFLGLRKDKSARQVVREDKS